MSDDRLKLTELRGSAHSCGEQYGRAFETAILGFLRQELRPDKKRLAYARRCWPHVERTSPTAGAFMEGMAKGCRLSLDHVTLLMLHEEICHLPHCTAFVATGAATRGGKTIVAQNWDWAPNLYQWGGLLRLRITGQPRTLTLHYPGLWAGAGLNEHGLALMWTTGGVFPRIKPVVGVPTYVVIAELLLRRTVDEALAYLDTLRHAGCFIFMLGDARGGSITVEAMPGRRVTVRDPLISRANHYRCNDVIRCGKQITPSKKKTSTLQREARMEALLRRYRGKIDAAATKKILTDRGSAWPWLHQYPAGRGLVAVDSMTLDSLIALCDERVLWTCRGGRAPGPWVKVKV
ncbi:MAG: C45 family peptidase [Planctomycetes bacterium]|nr:C45 family peptidase [Planctomycetota bacterium]